MKNLNRWQISIPALALMAIVALERTQAQQTNEVHVQLSDGYGALLTVPPTTRAPADFVDKNQDHIDDRLQTGPGTPPLPIGALYNVSAGQDPSWRLVYFQRTPNKDGKLARYVFESEMSWYIFEHDRRPGVSYPVAGAVLPKTDPSGLGGVIQARVQPLTKEQWMASLPQLRTWVQHSFESPYLAGVVEMARQANATFGISEKVEVVPPAFAMPSRSLPQTPSGARPASANPQRSAK